MPSSSRPTEATATVKLRVVASAVAELVGRELELRDAPSLIGRADDCDLPVADPSMSRRHARVEAAGDALRVVDNGSANGVLVDGARVAEATLPAGRRFTLGQTEFEVVVELPPTPVEPSAPAPSAAETPLVERTMTIKDIQASGWSRRRTGRSSSRIRRRSTWSNRGRSRSSPSSSTPASRSARAPTSSPSRPGRPSSAWIPTATAWAPASSPWARPARSCAATPRRA
jgi:predicted component of type VI protein secretion system